MKRKLCLLIVCLIPLWLLSGCIGNNNDILRVGILPEQGKEQFIKKYVSLNVGSISAKYFLPASISDFSKLRHIANELQLLSERHKKSVIE